MKQKQTRKRRKTGKSRSFFLKNRLKTKKLSSKRNRLKIRKLSSKRKKKLRRKRKTKTRKLSGGSHVELTGRGAIIGDEINRITEMKNNLEKQKAEILREMSERQKRLDAYIERTGIKQTESAKHKQEQVKQEKEAELNDIERRIAGLDPELTRLDIELDEYIK